jgi:hypothetical protein
MHHIAVNHGLTLLNMGKRLPETCLAESKINKIVIVASSWSLILSTYECLLFIIVRRTDLTSPFLFLSHILTYQMLDLKTTHLLHLFAALWP